MTSWLW